MNKPLSLIVILLSISILSCVPASKYRELQNASRQNMMDRDDYKTENLTLSMQNRETATRIATLEAEMTRTKQDIALAEIERNKAREELNTISDRYYALQNAQEDLVRGNLTETKKLLAELQAAQDNLRQKEDIMRQLEHSMDLRKISLDELNLELEKKNARMAELEKVLDTQKKIVEDLKTKVSEALMGFENKGLTVTNRDGKVYLSLDEKLLFKSASWDIDANGRNALKKLAAVLERNPGIQITIEGHTDNVPYRPGSGNLSDNWDLSVKRATTVVRTLLEGSKINPSRLTASGRGEFVPVETGDTPEARQKNRRTEIILTPDLTELYNLINQH
ncbi:MAG TPA: OmpA family protein [Bacteroidales bacterium]|nr:OmpA family protein [Bacteroidales bacterium]HOG57692.1 OmpA family protein [Bacteroidales bacterium]HPX43421.1 OmpA family protein [Bacteroidales bacterium]HQB86085.1 OmpA family protein [Bacteroidales bacterium]